jgi:hypothetical protein
MKKYLILLLLPVFVLAGIGEITAISGDVKIKRDNQTLQAELGTSLEKNDFISTDKKGKVQIIFKDKTVFTIGKNSTLDIADYLYDETQPKKNSAKFNVLKGAFSSITGRIGKLNKSKFKLKTKSASIGIRGTIVKANQSEVICTEGAITVETLTGMAVRVEAGQKTVIVNGVPGAPVTVTNEDIKLIDKEAGVVSETGKTEENTQMDDEVQSTAFIKEDEELTQIDLQKHKEVKDSESEMRNVTLTGYNSLDHESEDVLYQTVNIEAQNIQGDLSLEEGGLTMTDDQGNAINQLQMIPSHGVIGTAIPIKNGLPGRKLT